MAGATTMARNAVKSISAACAADRFEKTLRPSGFSTSTALSWRPMTGAACARATTGHPAAVGFMGALSLKDRLRAADNWPQ